MNLFFAEDLTDHRVILNAEESHHCTIVLRKRVGDLIAITDGVGTLSEAQIAVQDKKKVIVEIISRTKKPAPPVHLHIAVCPTKQASRMEWFLEQACVFGVREITPIFCERSERRQWNDKRPKKVLLSAMKQSLSCYETKLHPARSLLEFLETQIEVDGQHKLFAHLSSDAVELSSLALDRKHALVIIGPEGDFTSNEIERLKVHGFRQIALGRNRLRTETAAMAVASYFYMNNVF